MQRARAQPCFGSAHQPLHFDPQDITILATYRIYEAPPSAEHLVPYFVIYQHASFQIETDKEGFRITTNYGNNGWAICPNTIAPAGGAIRPPAARTLSQKGSQTSACASGTTKNDVMLLCEPVGHILKVVSARKSQCLALSAASTAMPKAGRFSRAGTKHSEPRVTSEALR